MQVDVEEGQQKIVDPTASPALAGSSGVDGEFILAYLVWHAWLD